MSAPDALRGLCLCPFTWMVLFLEMVLFLCLVRDSLIMGVESEPSLTSTGLISKPSPVSSFSSSTHGSQEEDKDKAHPEDTVRGCGQDGMGSASDTSKAVGEGSRAVRGPVAGPRGDGQHVGATGEFGWSRVGDRRVRGGMEQAVQCTSEAEAQAAEAVC